MPKAEGDRVKPGDLLVRFEIPVAARPTSRRGAAKSTRREARVENAQASVTRLTTLVEHGVAAQKELEDARRDLAEARAALAPGAGGARRTPQQLESRDRRPRDASPASSPSAATIPATWSRRRPADVILRVVDPVEAAGRRRRCRSRISRACRSAQPVRILVPGADEPEAGKVLTRPAAVDPTGVAGRRADRLQRSRRSSPSARRCRVEIVAEQHPNALAVPVEAVLHEDEDAFVMVAGADNKAHKRKVTIGLTTPKLVEITGGLKAGEAVIVQGQQGLPDGATITQEK